MVDLACDTYKKIIHDVNICKDNIIKILDKNYFISLS